VRLGLEILITIGGGGFGRVWFYVQIGFLPTTPGESFDTMIDWHKGYTREPGTVVMSATAQTCLLEAEQG